MLSTDMNRVVGFLEEERKRLARDVHDGPAQSLTNAAMRIEIVRKLLEADRTQDAVSELERLQGMLRRAVSETRRLVFDLRPSFLEHGVERAISLYAERFAEAFGIAVRVSGGWAGRRLSQAAEITVFRVLQEALNNVHQHAQATRVDVRLSTAGDRCVLEIEDDGQGFEMGETPGTFGLHGMQERTALVGGRVSISSSPGHGTRVVCEVPCDVGA
ncbi:MAG: sensor histidine kinase [Alicyclobacillus sp.]|nr:sensor histidine kinase [Alicyclobacillus sp.]